MELLYISISLVSLSVIMIVFLSPSKAKNLPPGKTGWLIGESIEYLTTNLMLQPTVVFSGASAHKFLFDNENKLL
ncbi:hypothetical protein CsSME_00049015 [Camellia sinensis var. sinensis]